MTDKPQTAKCDHDWEDIIVDPDFRVDVCMNCGLERSTDIKNSTVAFTPGTPDPTAKSVHAGRRVMSYETPNGGSYSVEIYAQPNAILDAAPGKLLCRYGATKREFIIAVDNDDDFQKLKQALTAGDTGDLLITIQRRTK